MNPLLGQRVLITRAADDAVAWASSLMEAGAVLADEPAMSFLKTRAETKALLSEAGFERIETLDTGPKYVEGYRTMLAKNKADGPPILGPRVVGGDDMAARMANSTRSIEEGRTFPIEVVCAKLG